MTEAEAAKELGVSIGSMRNLRKRGEIGFVKILNKIYYTPDQLLTFLESHRVEPTQATITTATPPATPRPRGPHRADDPTSHAIVAEIVRETFKFPKKLGGRFQDPGGAE